MRQCAERTSEHFSTCDTPDLTRERPNGSVQMVVKLIQFLFSGTSLR